MSAFRKEDLGWQRQGLGRKAATRLSIGQVSHLLRGP